MSLLKNLKKRGLSDILNFKKVKVFAKYLANKGRKRKYKEFSTPEFVEQMVVRMNKCPDCLIEGECLHCGCKSPELFYDKDNFCSENRWEEMVSPEKWESYKKEKGITVNPKHIKEILSTGIITWK